MNLGEPRGERDPKTSPPGEVFQEGLTGESGIIARTTAV
jgi:hypothetical protein